MNPQELIRVRFAPSPTGNPHVGNFRTALYNYLFARHCDGAFLLRLEDTDRERSKAEYEQSIFDSLNWMGMKPDEEPVRQSERIERHRQEAHRLLAEGKAYRCRMTSEELDALRERQSASGQKPMYDGRDRDKNYPDDGTPFTVRVKTPLSGMTSIQDRLRGEVAVANEEIEDFIILRSDGSPTYNFAVVVDDFDMGITHVLRGDDHLSNTIRQAILYQMLGYPLPEFVHLPQILGQDRARLSKRHGATGVLEYRDQGYLPEAIINYLARLGWAHGDQEFFTPRNLIEVFTLDNLNRSSAIFDPQKLMWLNGEHIRAMEIDELARRFIEFAQNLRVGQTPPAVAGIGQAPPAVIRKIVACTQERSRTLLEMAEMVAFLFQPKLVYEEKEAKKTLRPEALEALLDLAAFAESRAAQPPSDEEWEKEFTAIMEKRELKMRVFAQAARFATTGTKISPPIFNVFDLLGPEETAHRLRQAVEFARGLHTHSAAD